MSQFLIYSFPDEPKVYYVPFGSSRRARADFKKQLSSEHPGVKFHSSVPFESKKKIEVLDRKTIQRVMVKGKAPARDVSETSSKKRLKPVIGGSFPSIVKKKKK